VRKSVRPGRSAKCWIARIRGCADFASGRRDRIKRAQCEGNGWNLSRDIDRPRGLTVENDARRQPLPSRFSRFRRDSIHRGAGPSSGASEHRHHIAAGEASWRVAHNRGAFFMIVYARSAASHHADEEDGISRLIELIEVTRLPKAWRSARGAR